MQIQLLFLQLPMNAFKIVMLFDHGDRKQLPGTQELRMFFLEQVLLLAGLNAQGQRKQTNI